MSFRIPDAPLRFDDVIVVRHDNVHRARRASGNNPPPLSLPNGEKRWRKEFERSGEILSVIANRFASNQRKVRNDGKICAGKKISPYRSVRMTGEIIYIYITEKLFDLRK